MTVFYPIGNNSAMTGPSAQFSCLRTIDLTDARVATMKNGSSDKLNVALKLSSGYCPGLGAIAALAISHFFMMYS
jgi:hypothetical protein